MRTRATRKYPKSLSEDANTVQESVVLGQAFDDSNRSWRTQRVCEFSLEPEQAFCGTAEEIGKVWGNMRSQCGMATEEPIRILWSGSAVHIDSLGAEKNRRVPMRLGSACVEPEQEL